jgi:hypothetical protein
VLNEACHELSVEQLFHAHRTAFLSITIITTTAAAIATAVATTTPR